MLEGLGFRAPKPIKVPNFHFTHTALYSDPPSGAENVLTFPGVWLELRLGLRGLGG